MCILDYLDSDQLNQLGFMLLVDSNRYFFTAQLNFPALPEPSWNHGGLICVGDHVTELGKLSFQTKIDFFPVIGQMPKAVIVFSSHPLEWNKT